MGAGESVPREDHERQVRTLRDRFERRLREQRETTKARVGILEAEGKLFREAAGAAAVVGGLTVVFLLTRARSARSATAAAAKFTDKASRLAAMVKDVETRAAKDVEAARAAGTKAFSKDLLGVVDDLERSLEDGGGGGGGGGGGSGDGTALRDGVDLVHKNLLKTLGAHGVQRLDTRVGARFDPTVHEAMNVQPTEDPALDDTVAGVLQHGYELDGGVLLRSPKVSVYQHRPESDK